jgi:glucan biosynthesis protein C
VTTQATGKSVTAQRRWDIDWLRVVATLLLFYIHSAKIFYLWGPWHIQNTRNSRAFSYLSLFIEHWHMPLFFILAGAASWFALRRRSGDQYVKERFKRLLIPFVFGLLVIVPPQIYFDLLAHFRYVGSYLQFYPRFFDPAYLGKFDMGHLWFILHLFVFSLIALPLFLYLKRDSGQRLMERLAGFFVRPGAILLLVIPIMVTDYVLLCFYPNPVYFITFFLYGYILMADVRFEEAIDRHRGLALVLGLTIYVVWISLVTLDVIHPDWLQPIWRSLIAWSCLIAVLGYGRKHLNFTNKWLVYGNDTIMPFYLFHQPVIIVIAFFVVQWDAGITLKLLVVALGSLLVSLGLVELVIKRINALRVLFGIKTRRREMSSTEAKS